MILAPSDQHRLLSRCPTCRRELAWRESPHQPFCSVACRLIDLGVWLEERYRIPAVQRSPAQERSPEN